MINEECPVCHNLKGDDHNCPECDFKKRTIAKIKVEENTIEFGGIV